MSGLLTKLVFAGFVLAIVAGSAPSQIRTVDDLSTPVSNGGSIKYSDLLKLVFPDLESHGTEASATRTVAVRHAFGHHEPMPLQGKFDLGSVDTITIRDPAGPVTLLQLDLTAKKLEDNSWIEGDAVSLLAAFRKSPELKLLDVIDLKTDKYTELFRGKPTFPVSANQDAVVLVNEHDDSSESFDEFTAYFLWNGKFQQVFDLFLISTAGCGRSITQTLAVSHEPNQGSRFFPISVRVRVVKKRDPIECDKPTRGYVRVYSGVYRFNLSKKRFVTSSIGLARLDKLNRSGG